MPDRMRVLALFGSVVLFGAERGNIEALAALKRQGAEILCLVSDDAWNERVPPALEARGFAWRRVPYIYAGWNLGWVDWLWRNPRRFLLANMAFLKAIREFRPTHVHAYAPIFVANFFAGLLVTKTPLVYRAGDEPPRHNWAWRVVWRLTVWRTAAFVANCHFVARALRESGVAAQNITVVYNVPPARATPPRAALEIELPTGARSFGYIGQMSEHKGPHVLIDAFRELAADFPQARLLLAGRISDWEGDAWARSLRDATKADPVIGGRVTFLGEVEDVPGLLARCEALVVPSLFDEPSAAVVMEAKQAGKAVIVFPRGGLPELVEDGIDGLLCHEASKSALVRALRTYLEDPAKAREHGTAAAATRARFGHAQFDANWYNVYLSARRRTGRQDAAACPSLSDGGRR